MKNENVDSVEVNDVLLTLIHNGKFYESVQPAIKNLAAKVACCKFDKEKAPKIFENAINSFMMSKEWLHIYGEWRPSVKVRKAVAVEMFDYYSDLIVETAESLIGPEFVAVDVCDWGHDSSGNPTARHHVYTSTVDGGRVRLLNDRKVRRQQVGYGDRLDSCQEAIGKAGVLQQWYALKNVTGSRSDDSIVAVYERIEVKI